MSKFRIYLSKKYNVRKAYYFIGYFQKQHAQLYKNIEDAGFILMFKEHSPAMLGWKKGNVDADIVFYVMKNVYKNNNFNQIILVSGDGDYKLLVNFLLQENKFNKILFPNKKRASYLYKKMGGK